jgi:RNA polymerase sigma-B factor
VEESGLTWSVRRRAQDALDQTPTRTREVLHLRFVEDMTQAQIAERIGVSQMHVCGSSAAVADLREAVEGEDAWKR